LPVKDNDSGCCIYERNLPITGESKAFQLYCISVTDYLYRKEEDNEIDPDLVKTIHSFSAESVYDFFRLVYIRDGIFDFRSSDFTGMVKGECLLLILPEEKHSLMPNFNDSFSFTSVLFSGKLPRLWLEERYISKNTAPLQVPYDNDIRLLFDRIILLSREQKTVDQPLIASCIIRIFAQYYSERNSSLLAVKESFDPVDFVTKYCQTNLYTKISMDDICEKLNMNYYQLRAYFNDRTGMSPYQFLIDIKIKKAIELLENTDYPVKTIAYKLAFDSQYYFSRLFKRKTGISPSRWVRKKEHRQ
jgi:AraC-like DNA-binding protein